MDEKNKWEIGNILKNLENDKLYLVIDKRDHDNELCKILIQNMQGLNSWEYKLFIDKYYVDLGPAGKGFGILWLQK